MVIIQNLSGVSRLKRLRRAIVTLLGMIFTLAAIIGTTPVLLLVMILLFSLIRGTAPPDLSERELLFFLLTGAGSFLCFYIGRRLIRGKRHLILFLRKFGFQSASRALTFAVSTAFGRHWRLVTLDDAEIASMGVPGGKRQTVRIGRWILLLALIFAILYVVFWFMGDKPGAIVEDIFDNIFSSSQRRGDNLLTSLLGAVVGTIAVGAVVLGISLALMLLGTALTASAMLFSWNAWREVLKAERSRVLKLRDKNRIKVTVKRAVKRANRIFAPRLAVLQVSGAIWQQVVRDLAASVDAVLVDISKPSENLLWEIETLKNLDDTRCLFVGKLDQVRKIIEGDEKKGSQDDDAHRLKSLLDDDEVLTYRDEEKKTMRIFAKNLEAYLETVR